MGEIARLEEMKKGWFVGSFDPTIHSTDLFEVAVKEYKAGEKEGRHVHKVAVEITVVLNGRVKMNGRIFEHGDIIKICPGEDTDFEALTDVITVVVKSPCVLGDKYSLE